MSLQQEPVRQGDGPAEGQPPAGRPAAGGSAPGAPAGQLTDKVFRLTGPLVLWWGWVVFAAANLVDLAVQGHDRTSLQVAVGLLAITGLVYACALRPRIITDANGLTMLNPIREYRVPWGRLSEIHLGEYVEVRCSPGGTAGGKVLHSWALYAPRRSRLRAEIRGRRWDRSPASRPGGYARMPAEAQEVAKQTPAELMAREIQAIASQASKLGAADGPVVASWAWRSLAAVLLPVAALVLLIVIR
ncbi:MAG: hypothetical protein ABSA03_08455 [Streptosporangiaceae bacterium]